MLLVSEWIVGLALLALCAPAPARAAEAATWHVSPTGSDANPGTARRPFATLERARRAVRLAGAHRPAVVYLHAGTHYLPDTLRLGPEDSGARAAPVTYAAYPGEFPVVSGGRRLRLVWKPWRGPILQAETPVDFDTDQLFVNGERRPMARYPDFDPNQRILNGFAEDAISPERAARWANPAGAWIHAMHSAEWGDYHYRVTGRAPEGALHYEGGWQNNRQMGMHPRHRFIENVLEELDAPDEWFFDRASHTLYFYPPAGLRMEEALVEGVRLRHLVELRGVPDRPVRHVAFRGITFRHAARTFMDTREPLLRSDWTIYRGGALFITGAEDCSVVGCNLEQLGGNAIFLSGRCRRIAVRSCHIPEAGANGVAIVGDPGAVRSPLFEYGQRQALAQIDRTPGPKSDNYPADCIVEDCLIYRSGRVEKQTAPIEIDIAARITVRHCSLYDVPRAGINIGDGCWGGHLIEGCDVFDTVKETGDHGSFNSWGRDRYWGLTDVNLDDAATWQAHGGLPLLDAMETTILRHNRWRCDHGWDIDLDDGSSNYRIVGNLCLNGGIKCREGFDRMVENNIIINNGFHPHVWFAHSGDVFRRNVVGSDEYHPAGGMPPHPWGAEMDRNLVHAPGRRLPGPATGLAAQSGRDAASIVADARFRDPAAGDFRLTRGSPALKLGFVDLGAQSFGVVSPRLRAIARTPAVPPIAGAPAAADGAASGWLWGASVRDIAGAGDRSVYGLPSASGVLVLEAADGSDAHAAGLRTDDVIISCAGRPVRSLAELLALPAAQSAKPLPVGAIRKQAAVLVTVAGRVCAKIEARDDPGFALVPLRPAGRLSPVTIAVGATATVNEPVATLLDGMLAANYGPVFPNGVLSGSYRIDLGEVHTIERVESFAYNEGGNRGRQRYALFASASASDPGWNPADRSAYTAIATVDTTAAPQAVWSAVSVRRSDGRSLGAWRWLLWVTSPISGAGGGEHTAFQELQVVGSSPPQRPPP